MFPDFRTGVLILCKAVCGEGRSGFLAQSAVSSEVNVRQALLQHFSLNSTQKGLYSLSFIAGPSSF